MRQEPESRCLEGRGLDFSLYSSNSSNSLDSLYSLNLPPAVFFPQILNPIFRLRRFAGGAGHEIVR
jgi:hypothetical protein